MVKHALAAPRHAQRHSHIASDRTLVGAGLKRKEETQRRLADLIPSHLAHIPDNVKVFEPRTNSVTTSSGRKIGYESLVVATGLQINWSSVPGLETALADPASGVSSIYSYDTADKVWRDIDALQSGKAIFTQPAGVIKCGGGASSTPIQVNTSSRLRPLNVTVRTRMQPLKRSCGWPGIGTTRPAEATRSPSTSTRARRPCSQSKSTPTPSTSSG